MVVLCSAVLHTIVSTKCPANYPILVGSICLFKSSEKANYCEAIKSCKDRGGELLRGEKNLQEVIQVVCWEISSQTAVCRVREEME